VPPSDHEDVDLPAGIGRPARRALVAKGYRRLDDLDGVSADEIADLHGVGPRALQRLRQAMEDRGLSLA
jgi:hypothetical protein